MIYLICFKYIETLDVKLKEVYLNNEPFTLGERKRVKRNTFRIDSMGDIMLVFIFVLYFFI